MFAGLDLNDFWENSDYAREAYVEEQVTRKLVLSVEGDLGFRLPPAYVALMRTQNGGIPTRTCFPTKVGTSWAKDHIAITGILGIGRTKTYSLLGSLGSRFMQENWGYPNFGVCICNCPSAGHDMVMLDYRACGPAGEPVVVHVDQESDFHVTPLAPDFEAFVRGLVYESEYDTSTADLANALAKIQNGAFSTSLKRLLSQSPASDRVELALRSLLRSLATKKGCFALHSDPDSHLVYDVLFDLFASSQAVRTSKSFLDAYEDLLAFGDGDITTDGYAPDFVAEWMKARLAAGHIEKRQGKLRLSDTHRSFMAMRLSTFLE